MPKPVLVIKVRRINLLTKNRMEELERMAKVIVESVGEEYHVLFIEENYDVFILDGKKIEVTDLEILEIKRKIEEGYRELK